MANWHAPIWLQSGCSKRLEVRLFERIKRQTMLSSTWSHRLLTFEGSRHFQSRVCKIIFISKKLICDSRFQRIVKSCFHCHHKARTEACATGRPPIGCPVMIRTSAPVWFTLKPRCRTKVSSEAASSPALPYDNQRVMGAWIPGWALQPGARPRRFMICAGTIRGSRSWHRTAPTTAKLIMAKLSPQRLRRTSSYRV